MDGYSVSIDLSGVFAEAEAQINAMFPRIAKAIARTAEHGANQWKASVWKAKLLKAEKNEYFDSIKWKMTGSFSAEVWSDYRYADEIEKGRPARDLKKMLQTSKRVRISQSRVNRGKKYLIIPFRHNTPGRSALARPMPGDIYSIAENLSASSVLTPGSVKPKTRLSGSGHTVPQQSYKWGDRLPAGLAQKLQPHHKTDIYAGMVRFDASKGASKSSSYLTFRVMGEWSNGWLVKPKPGLYLAKNTAANLQQVLDKSIGKAISMSIVS